MENCRFQVRTTEQELKELDEAIKVLGYAGRSDWFKKMKKITMDIANGVAREVYNSNPEVMEKLSISELESWMEETDRKIAEIKKHVFGE